MSDIQTVMPILPKYKQLGLQINQLLQNSSMPQRLVMEIFENKSECYFGGIGFDSTETKYMELITNRMEKLNCINNEEMSQWIQELANYKQRRLRLKEKIIKGSYIYYYQKQIENEVRLKTRGVSSVVFLVSLALVVILYLFTLIFAQKEYYTHVHEMFIWDAKEISFNQVLLYQLINRQQKPICQPLQNIILHFPFGYSRGQISSLQIVCEIIFPFIMAFGVWILLVIMTNCSEGFKKIMTRKVYPLQKRIQNRGGPLRLVYPRYHISQNYVYKRRQNNLYLVEYDYWYLSRIDWEIQQIQRRNYDRERKKIQRRNYRYRY